MSKAKVTPWFDGDVKPVRVGLYQREYSLQIITNGMPDFWDGKKWLLCSDKGNPICTALNQNRPWRGLASRPR